MNNTQITGKPTEPGLYLQTWSGRTAKVRVYRQGARLVWAHVGTDWPNEMDTIDGETWERIIEFPQTEVITWNEGMPPDGVIVLAKFRGGDPLTLAMIEIEEGQPPMFRFHDGNFEEVDASELIAWALPKGPR